MKIAITAENNNGLDSTVAQHFGKTPFFVLADVEDKEIKNVTTIVNPFAAAHAPGDIPNFVKEQGAEVILSGGMGGRAIQFFSEAGVQAVTGAAGTVRESLENFLSGNQAEAAPCAESVDHGHG